MKKFFRWLIGESLLHVIRDARTSRRNLYLCDPFTAAIIAGAAGLGGGMLLSGDKDEEPAAAPAPAPVDTGAVKGVESIDAQAAQRRLARLSKYFTSPTGVLDASTGSSGVF